MSPVPLPVTAICVQAQTANISSRLLMFETARLPIQTARLPLVGNVRDIEVQKYKRGCYFGRNCHVLTCKITYFIYTVCPGPH